MANDTADRGARYTQALEGIPHAVVPARSLVGGLAGRGAAVGGDGPLVAHGDRAILGWDIAGEAVALG